LQNFYDAFRDYGFRQEAFFPCYGLAEATLFVSGGPDGRLPNVLEIDSEALERNRVSISLWKDGQASEIVGCGRAWGDTRVEIVNPETGIPCLPGEIGEIWLSGGSVAKGYWQRPMETTESFHAYIADTDEGPFLRTGDLGFLQEGELFITGRLKDLIIIRGRNIYPHDVESTVEQVVGFVKPNTCAAFSIETDGQEALALVIEADRKLVRVVQRWNNDRDSLDANMIFYTGGAQIREVERLVSRIRQAVTQEYEVPLHRIAFVMPGTFPRTTSGKVQRSACRSKMLKGELEVVFSSDSTQGLAPQYGSDKPGIKSVADLKALIRDRVLRVLADELKMKVDHVDFDTPLTSLGLDSLGMVTLALDLEEKTGKAVTGDILYENQTISELAAYLSSPASLPWKQNTAGKRLLECAPATRLNGTATAIVEKTERYRQATRRFDKWQQEGKYFFHTPFSMQSDAWVVSEGKQMLMLGSYSYLGLMRHPSIIEASCHATEEYGGRSP
jgi:acyl carrier protein